MPMLLNAVRSYSIHSDKTFWKVYNTFKNFKTLKMSLSAYWSNAYWARYKQSDITLQSHAWFDNKALSEVKLKCMSYWASNANFRMLKVLLDEISNLFCYIIQSGS